MMNVFPKAIIFGCQGVALTPEEKVFFRSHQPLGFILFSWNCESPDQIRALIQELKSCVHHANVPILIDQEGGRVARLKPPHFRPSLPAGFFANLVIKQGLDYAREAVYLNARLMGAELYSLGITVNCAPIADLSIEGAHNIIGDRSFGGEVPQVVCLANAMSEGLLDSGIIPIVKHIPGHGRALVDSHEALPRVDAPLSLLEKTDFAAFTQLAHIPWAMTAHIIYEALDASHPATCSSVVVDYIRKKIGFDGVLISDDLSMKALSGSFTEKAARSLAAGCDLLLHCNGHFDEMEILAHATPPLSKSAALRVEKSFNTVKPQEHFTNINHLAAKFSAMIG